MVSEALTAPPFIPRPTYVKDAKPPTRANIVTVLKGQELESMRGACAAARDALEYVGQFVKVIIC